MVSLNSPSRAGVVSHILRNRTTSPSTGVATDRWFHYDQVGSVIAESDAAGALAQTHHQDAFGNTQAAWQTGLWGGDRAGWHHNTKELDGDTGLVYMYQRWYAPETGTFMSSAPYPVMVEHRYGFAENRPGLMVDPDGRQVAYVAPSCSFTIGPAGGVQVGIYIDFNTGNWGMYAQGAAGGGGGLFIGGGATVGYMNGSEGDFKGRGSAHSMDLGYIFAGGVAYTRTSGGVSGAEIFGGGGFGANVFTNTITNTTTVPCGNLYESFWGAIDSISRGFLEWYDHGRKGR
jgi:RHS repeat-associated protein